MKKFFFLFLLLISLCMVACAGGAQTTTKDDYKLKIAGPSGAPLMASAQALDGKDYELNLNLAPESLKPLFANKSVDFIIAPINLGATLYSKNQNYKLACILTWGNLYFASKASLGDVSSLNGKDLVLFGEGTVNDIVVKYVLENYNITPKSTTYLGDTQLTQAQLLNDTENKIYLVAEPALSAAKNKNSDIKSLSVQSYFEAKSGAKKFTQAGLFVNTDTIKDHKGLVDSFINDVKASCEAVKNNKEALVDAAINLGITTPKAVLLKAIDGCNIEFKKSMDAKAEVEFSANLGLNLFGGALPADEFYYA